MTSSIESYNTSIKDINKIFFHKAPTLSPYIISIVATSIAVTTFFIKGYNQWNSSDPEGDENIIILS
jgi:hypothetical protein